MHAREYPVWASLARDYLAVMASSVSSERAFSSAGITISKRRNRLKADLVEALQGLKCLFRTDLLFREGVTVASEKGNEEDDDQAEDDAEGAQADDETGSWDDLIADIDDDDLYDE